MLSLDASQAFNVKMASVFLLINALWLNARPVLNAKTVFVFQFVANVLLMNSVTTENVLTSVHI